MNAHAQILKPDVATMNAHIHELCHPTFTHNLPNAVLEIAYGHPVTDGGDVNQAQTWSALNDRELQLAAKSAAALNSKGVNVYIGAALRDYGDRTIPPDRRAKADNYLASRFAWVDFDEAGDAERIEAVLKQYELVPAMIVTTGTVPHLRGQLYFLTAGIKNANHLKEVNSALQRLLGTDAAVVNAHQPLRLAGSASYPPEKKAARGYIPELTTLKKVDDAPTYQADYLIGLASPSDGATGNTEQHSKDGERSTASGHVFAGYANDHDLEANPELIVAALEHIPNDDLHWDEWKRVAMAAWRATRGSKVAFEAFDKWSRKSGKYDAKETRRQWTKIFRSPPTEIGAGTIFKLALDNGWVWPHAERSSADEGVVAGEDSAANADEGATSASDGPTVGAGGSSNGGAAGANPGGKRNGAALPLTFFGEFGNKAKKRPILKGFINKGEISALIAPPKRGKSALMAEIAIHCAAGKDWRDSSASDACGVVIFAIERADLYRRRLDAYALRDGYKNLPIAVAGKVIDLLNPQCVQTLVATVREAEQRFARPVGMIVIDTYSKGIAAGGGDENSAKDQNRVAANLRRVQELIDVHISCVGHTGKDPSKGARGSNAHLGDVDLMIQITGDAATKTAKVTDANDQPERVIAQFLLEAADTSHVDDDGEVETVAIIAKQDVSSPDTGEGKLSDKQQVALGELFNCIADDETASPPNNVHVPTGAKGVNLTTWRNRLAARGVINPKGNPYQEFQRIHLKLQKLGKIGIWEDFVWPVI